MKRLLYSFLLSMAMLSAGAQTTLTTALPMNEGANSYEMQQSDSSRPVFWKYTAPDNQSVLLQISDYGSFSTSFWNADSVSTYISSVQGSLYYPLEAGQTIYFSLTTYNPTTLSFTATATPDATIGRGYTADDAVTLGDDQQAWFIISPNKKAYATYTPTEDGVLEIYSTASIYTSCYYTVDGGNSVSFSVDKYVESGKYQAKITVESGKKYDFSFGSGYSTIVFRLTSLLTHPTVGTSYDLPFTGVVGANTLPAAAGSYWYSYQPDRQGYYSTAKDGTFEGGQVKIFQYYGSAPSYAKTQSDVGSFETKWEETSTSNTYLINIIKATATDADETFQLTYADYAQGEKESNPIEIASVPATVTTGTNASYYYSVVADAAHDGQFLVVTATTDMNSGSNISLYERGSYTREYGKPSVRKSVEAGKTYIINFSLSNVTEGITFTVDYEAAAQGDTFDNPLPAVQGSNAINSDGTLFYSYTATIDGRIVLTRSKSSFYFSFPKAATGYDTWSYTSSGDIYTLPCTSGTTFIIKVNGGQAGESFTLEEGEYQQGESETNPIVLTDADSPYAITAETNNKWLQYVAPKAGVFELKVKTAQNYSNSLNYRRPTDTYNQYINYDTANGCYNVKFATAEGDAILIKIALANPVEGDELTFGVRDYQDGEAATQPVTLKKDEPTDVPALSNTEFWYKLTLQPGDLTIAASSSVSAYWYSSLADAQQNVNGQSVYFSSDYSVNPPTFTLNKSIDTAGDYYLKVTYCYSGATLTATGTAMPEVKEPEPQPSADPLTMEDAWGLEEGHSEYTFIVPVEGYTAPAFWVYDAPKDQDVLLKLTPSSVTAMTILDPDSVQMYTWFGLERELLFPVEKGETVYLQGLSTAQIVSFDTEILPLEQFGRGESADDAFQVKTGTYYLTDLDESDNRPTAYYSYTATEDGVLDIYATVYVNGQLNGSALSFQPVQGNYVAHIKVTAGETYAFSLTAGEMNRFCLYAELTHPTEGSTYDNAIIAIEGENTVPKAAGDYWYVYETTDRGTLSISAEQALPEGYVALFQGDYPAAQGTKMFEAAQSATGSYNVTHRLTQVGKWYIRVRRAADADADETFTLSYEGEQKGATEENPIIISEFPATIEPKPGDTYYQFTTPEGSQYILTGTTSQTITSNYTLLFVKGATGSSVIATGQQLTAVLDGGLTYRLQAVNKEAEAISYSLTLQKVEQGDLITNPATAVLGENTMTGAQTKFYTYTTTRDCRLAVTPAKADITVSFPKSVNEYEGTLTAKKEGRTTSIVATGGETYYIKLQNVTAGDTFTVEERDFEPGETQLNPIDVTTIYTFNDETSEVWMRYTAKREGTLDVSSDIAYDGSRTFEYLYNGATVQVDLSTDDKTVSAGHLYRASIPVAEGDIVLVHVKAAFPEEGKRVFFSLRDRRTGDTPEQAQQLQSGSFVKLTRTSNSVRYWCRVSTQPGAVTLSADGDLRARVYASFDDIAEGRYIAVELSADKPYTFEGKADGEVYIECYENRSEVTISAAGEGIATGVQATRTSADERVYDARQTVGRGFYIVTRDGQTRKVFRKNK